MVAKSIDVFVLLRLLLKPAQTTYAQLSSELGISASEIHAAVGRSVKAGLLHPENREPLRKPLADYLFYGVRYAFPAERGSIVRGTLTAHAAPPLDAHFHAEELPPVWPDSEGKACGYAVTPLCDAAPKAARSNVQLYELLALVDALRVGRARERNLALEELKKRLEHAGPA